MNIEKILQYLPHRYPFVLIDRVLSITESDDDMSIVALKNVTFNEAFFQGHFPNQPVMPGVLILEALAQAAAILAYKMIQSSYQEEEKEAICYLAGVDKVRFKRIVVPGDQLHLNVTVLRRRHDVWKLKGVATVENQVVCFGEFLSAVKLPSKENLSS